MEERYHATTQNRFYPDMSIVIKNITVEAKLISPPTYLVKFCLQTVYATDVDNKTCLRMFTLFFSVDV